MKNQDDLSRALRRHHRERLLANRRFYWGFDHELAGWERHRGRAVDTPTPCSCPMCGNSRKFFGERTVAERREMQRGAHD